MLGIILRLKQYADYENIIAEGIPRRLGVVPISQCRYGLLYDQNLDFFSYIEIRIVRNILEV